VNRQHFALSAFSVLMLVQAISVFAEPVFVGSPITKVSEGGILRTAETLPPDRAATLLCVISTDNGKYYWASRGNVELIPLSAGAFTTYIAVNGSGFVRVISPGLKEVASLAGETETSFDYVELLLLGLRSVTYYGVAK
jgi:hypothetical protein